ncbi:FAD-binding oxidoreductase [Paraburkholderia humisilvae]|uniref:6-hydroxy-D-nicotine oxidase n=1 Tax=Paraburkholderia humisilvae TaxID=627669 RepID=A0A6J5F0Q0_9BURK|nr:FAD-binding oxidoreductase [Paraburkholderia humisilvae]CAB3772430.1 6-hydroxy-D-nicotine oxidase [Paraburkholderia humisilvae]
MPGILKHADGSIVELRTVKRFINAFAGEVLLPGDADYDSARTLWNASIDKRPGLIARCTSTADVARVVTFARINNLLVSIKGGGHNVAGHALCDDGIVIDLAPMNRVTVDAASHTVIVQAGARLEDVDRETHQHGLAVPAGVMSKTGVGGLTLGGGIGWLSRKYGLTCDNLLSCELVSAQGEVLQVHGASHSDLFWALRGGGGNFGVVTSFSFRAHPVSTVLGGAIVYPREHAATVLRFYRDFMLTAPDELTAYVGMISTPEGIPATAIMMCYCGNPAAGEPIVQQLRTVAPRVFEAIQPMPFPAMQKLADPSSPDGIHNYWRSTFVNELSDAAIAVIVEQSNQAPSELSVVLVQIFSGAVNKVDAAATAFPHRNAGFNVAIEAKWPDTVQSARNIAWTRGFSDALKPFSSYTCLVNFLGDESANEVRAAFGSHYEQLVDVKTKYDPTNFFRLNQNIKPRM